jgi:hypothetical protein
VTRRVVPAALVLVLVVAACGDDTADTAPATGIRGKATMGPQCPVEVAGSPCPDSPFVGQIKVLTPQEVEVDTVLTDDQGRFQVTLVPGSYVVIADTGGPGPPFPEPQRVLVPEEGFAEVTLLVDTGIR